MSESEKKIYYDIIVKCWKTFSKERPFPEFSDDWWEHTISDFNIISAEYKNTDYADFAADLVMQFLNEQERRKKRWVKSGTI